MNQITQENLQILNARHRAAALMVGVQVVVVAVLIALSFKKVIHIASAPDEQTLMSMWMGILFLAAGSLLLRRLFNGWERLSNVAVLHGISGLTKRLLINAFVTCLFGVIAATIGFVISQITGDVMDMMRAAAVSFVVFYANFPRKSIWKKIVLKFQES